MEKSVSSHGGGTASGWVIAHAGLVPAGGRVLDLAAGGGRHSHYFADRGHPVVAVDRDITALAGRPGIECLRADLEDGSPWPLPGRAFAGVVVTNYLHRPLFPAIRAAVAAGGALIYETFARGNERFGKPSNPDFLLADNELLGLALPDLRVVAYEHLTIELPRPAIVQRIAAIRA
ncbi:MAG: SAM-dependent methyltransferase [Alphaproteobacteria bacterium]|nr:SAM-dependent methyltransferase [Alphaproteobacteria bacterium]